MTKEEVVTPERLHHHLARHSWTPLSGIQIIGETSLSFPIEEQKKKQKLGFPIKDFGNDEKGMSPLNVSITFCSSPRQSSSRGPQYLKAFGCPIKKFRERREKKDYRGKEYTAIAITPGNCL